MLIKLKENVKIAVVGDIHAHAFQFFKLLEQVNPSTEMILVSVGDIYDKGYGEEEEIKIISKMRDLKKVGFLYMVKGNHELKKIRKARQTNSWSPELQWIDEQPISLTFEYPNQTKITILHGGVLPATTIQDLDEDIEICYIRDVSEKGKMIKLKWVKQNEKNTLIQTEKGRPWHEYYDGRFGYIASGHEPQRDGKAKFYNYSCNLDSACFETGILSCQIFSSQGRGNLMTVSGPAKNPEL